ncbi:PREDICTED: bcl-2-like protein 10 [Propithecus coquereli]|uniref:Bcl-2-like protein 10 n=1 Tax=Propithecus coquereli TaxID=379532 RepID=A0A2K6F2Q2_PROCO|nr:PREDICTED: bcl-2-like protein 10 [Propithecus coquereli]
MGDRFRERTERLLADYLEYCTREPGAPGLPPSSLEAAAMRFAATKIRRKHASFFSAYVGYPGNRVYLLERMAEAVLCDSLSWGRVVMLVTFAGTLLERGPPVTAWWKKWGLQPQPKEGDPEVARDRQRLVALLCARLAGQHRAWLQAQGGWDGFCDLFRKPLPLAVWRRLLVQVLLSCFLATTVIYFWTRLL